MDKGKAHDVPDPEPIIWSIVETLRAAQSSGITRISEQQRGDITAFIRTNRKINVSLVTPLVEALERDGGSICIHLGVGTLVVLFAMLRLAEPCCAQQRGFVLLRDSLSGGDQVATGTQMSTATSVFGLARKTRKSRFGTAIMPEIIRSFLDEEQGLAARCYIGLLLVELAHECQSNQDFFSAALRCAEARIKLRACVTLSSTNDLVRCIALLFLRELRAAGQSWTSICPRDQSCDLELFKVLQAHDTEFGQPLKWAVEVLRHLQKGYPHPNSTARPHRHNVVLDLRFDPLTEGSPQIRLGQGCGISFVSESVFFLCLQSDDAVPMIIEAPLDRDMIFYTNGSQSTGLVPDPGANYQHFRLLFIGARTICANGHSFFPHEIRVIEEATDGKMSKLASLAQQSHSQSCLRSSRAIELLDVSAEPAMISRELRERGQSHQLSFQSNDIAKQGSEEHCQHRPAPFDRDILSQRRYRLDSASYAFGDFPTATTHSNEGEVLSCSNATPQKIESESMFHTDAVSIRRASMAPSISLKKLTSTTADIFDVPMSPPLPRLEDQQEEAPKVFSYKKRRHAAEFEQIRSKRSKCKVRALSGPKSYSKKRASVPDSPQRVKNAQERPPRFAKTRANAKLRQMNAEQTLSSQQVSNLCHGNDDLLRSPESQSKENEILNSRRAIAHHKTQNEKAEVHPPCKKISNRSNNVTLEPRQIRLGRQQLHNLDTASGAPSRVDVAKSDDVHWSTSNLLGTVEGASDFQTQQKTPSKRRKRARLASIRQTSPLAKRHLICLKSLPKDLQVFEASSCIGLEGPCDELYPGRHGLLSCAPDVSISEKREPYKSSGVDLVNDSGQQVRLKAKPVRTGSSGLCSKPLTPEKCFIPQTPEPDATFVLPTANDDHLERKRHLISFRVDGPLNQGVYYPKNLHLQPEEDHTPSERHTKSVDPPGGGFRGAANVLCYARENPAAYPEGQAILRVGAQALRGEVIPTRPKKPSSQRTLVTALGSPSDYKTREDMHETLAGVSCCIPDTSPISGSQRTSPAASPTYSKRIRSKGRQLAQMLAPWAYSDKHCNIQHESRTKLQDPGIATAPSEQQDETSSLQTSERVLSLSVEDPFPAVSQPSREHPVEAMKSMEARRGHAGGPLWSKSLEKDVELAKRSQPRLKGAPCGAADCRVFQSKAGFQERHCQDQSDRAVDHEMKDIRRKCVLGQSLRQRTVSGKALTCDHENRKSSLFTQIAGYLPFATYNASSPNQSRRTKGSADPDSLGGPSSSPDQAQSEANGGVKDEREFALGLRQQELLENLVAISTEFVQRITMQEKELEDVIKYFKSAGERILSDLSRTQVDARCAAAREYSSSRAKLLNSMTGFQEKLMREHAESKRLRIVLSDETRGNRLILKELEGKCTDIPLKKSSGECLAQDF